MEDWHLLQACPPLSFAICTFSNYFSSQDLRTRDTQSEPGPSRYSWHLSQIAHFASQIVPSASSSARHPVPSVSHRWLPFEPVHLNPNLCLSSLQQPVGRSSSNYCSSARHYWKPAVHTG